VVFFFMRPAPDACREGEREGKGSKKDGTHLVRRRISARSGHGHASTLELARPPVLERWAPRQDRRQRGAGCNSSAQVRPVQRRSRSMASVAPACSEPDTPSNFTKRFEVSM
jgi:hypothetical protein